MPSISPISTPEPPTDSDRRCHYIGVAGTLLARTSTAPHLPKGDLWGTRNVFRPIGPHPILSAWSDELVRSIKESRMLWTDSHGIGSIRSALEFAPTFLGEGSPRFTT